jgi:hypothetical protein
MDRLAPDLKAKIIGFGEYKMGAYKVDLVLRDGRIIKDVIVAWGDEVVRVGRRDDVSDLPVGEIVDAIDASGRHDIGRGRC